MKINVKSDYVPRPWQEKFSQGMAGKKRGFLLWARRHGKDIACWNYLILQAIQKRGSYYYLYPAQNQARKAIWEGMTSTGKRFLDYIPKELYGKDPNNSEMQITLINGSIIRILGSDNHDALRSSNPIGVVFSEYAWHHPHTWDAVVEPILRENKGWALFNTTPFGKNHAYDLWEYASKHPDVWYTERVTNQESSMLTEKDFQEMKERGVSEDIIQGEYYCNWNRGVEGAYYAKIIQKLRMDNKIKEVPKDDYAQVHTAWDIGFADSTAIFWFQQIQNEIRILDYYENNGEALPHYIHVLEERKDKHKYIYGTHYMPHDAGAKKMETGGSLASRAYDLGLKTVILPRENEKAIGIERVRKYLPRCYIDEKKCERAIKCLDSYRKKFNEKMQCYADEPLHDWSSHGCDAFRYLCQAIETCQPTETYTIEKHQELKAKHRNTYGYGQSPNSILGN